MIKPFFGALQPFLLAAAFLAALPFPAAALSLNKGGLGPPMPCGQYQVLSKMAFEGGKALSADSAEYTFSAKMTEGASGGECGAEKGSYIARINAHWDGKTRRATEQIVHQPPAIGKLTEVISECPGNPWTTEDNPNCTLISVKTDKVGMYAPAIAGPYPVSAYFAGYAVRKEIARLVSWTGSSDFVLPPLTPPSIVAADDKRDIDGRFYRRPQDVKAFVLRPTDGSPEWYTKNLKAYDVEVQTKVTTGDGWLGKSIVPPVPADSGAFSISYSRLFDDPDSAWSVENFGERGFYRSVRIRARIHDDAGSRPWSSWRSFLVEVPLRIKNPVIVPKPPGGLDGIKGGMK